MSLIISEDGKGAQRLNPTGFDKEDYLQNYIYNNPDAIPVYDIDEDIRLLVLAREFATNSGPIDALGVDQDGNLYVIETKLYKNPDKRTVVAQALDYGASLWRSSIDFVDFTQQLEKHVQAQFNMSVYEKLQEFFVLDDSGVDELLANMQTKLNSGNFKFVVLMDTLHRQLKDLIVFINQNSQFDVYAVELDYYKHQSFEIIIPRIFGAEVKKDIISKKSTSGSRRKWNRNSIFEEMTQKLSKPEQTAMQKLFDWLERNADLITYGTGKQAGSFIPRFTSIGEYAFVVGYTDGRIRLQFWGEDNAVFKPLVDLLSLRLSDQSLVSELKSACEKHSQKDIPPHIVVKEIDNIISALDGFVTSA